MTEASPPSILERARLDISQLRLGGSDDLTHALDSALRVSARTLEVERVGVWFLTPDRTALYRARVYDAARPEQVDDIVLALEGWPSYREAIVSRRVVAADDARTDPRTTELRDYLERFGIHAMLDAPLFLGGDVYGVVCHEHAGAPRTWTSREVDFAVSVADMLSTLLEQSMRLTAERRLRAAEQAAARSHQLSVAARTAAGIAHDVNTVLHAISMNAVAARSATDEATRNDALGAILDDTQRTARIIAQLKELEREPAAPLEALDLADVLRHMRPTLEALLGAQQTLDVAVDDNAYVQASRTDLERIVLNLVTNARDATPRDGAVKVRASVQPAGVALEVADDGPGLTAEAASHVFEPYWSTKGDGHGGLGLFIVHVTSARTGGEVTVESAPGKGAKFVVSWPPPAPSV